MRIRKCVALIKWKRLFEGVATSRIQTVTILISAVFRNVRLIRGSAYFNVDTQRCTAYKMAAFIRRNMILLGLT